MAKPPLQTERATRSELFEVSEPYICDVELQNTLDEFLRARLQPEAHNDNDTMNQLPRTTEADTNTATEAFFRLFSHPRTISLLPRPPPPSLTRGPEIEDSKAAAKTRRRWAKAAAVDASWVMQQSATLPPPFRAGRVEHVQVGPLLDGATPPVMFVQRLQSPRKTRPPVPRSQLQHYPYVLKPVLPPSEAMASTLPSIDIHAEPIPRKTRKRHRRRNIKERSRAQPTFWRPPLSQCLGYAMGY